MSDGQGDKVELEKAKNSPAVVNGPEPDQIFKSAEIYKTRANKTRARFDEFFDKKRDKKGVGEWIRGHKLIFAMAVLLVVVIILIIVLTILMINNQNSVAGEGDEIGENGTSSEIELTDENIEYQEITNSSELAAVVEFYDEKLAAAETDAEKAEIYTQRAADLYSYYDENIEGMKEQILADAKVADELLATAESANLAGLYYENLGGDADEVERYRELVEERDTEGRVGGRGQG